jgi:hypothetical protein
MIENLFLRAKSNFNSLEAGGIAELEYWSVGKSQSPRLKLSQPFHYSITPSLHYSRIKKRLSGLPLEQPKPGPLDE